MKDKYTDIRKRVYRYSEKDLIRELGIKGHIYNMTSYGSRDLIIYTSEKL